MTIRPRTTKSVVFCPNLLLPAGLRAGPRSPHERAWGGRLGALPFAGALLTLLTLLSLLVRALGSVCRTTLLTVARRDRTR